MLGTEADAVALYEQLFAHCNGLYFRYLDAFGDPVVFRGRQETIQQIGFGDDALWKFYEDRVAAE